MFLKNGGDVALVLGKLCSEMDAGREAQENLNSKAELCTTL